VVVVDAARKFRIDTVCGVDASVILTSGALNCPIAVAVV
jgi:hypothetical protein